MHISIVYIIKQRQSWDLFILETRSNSPKGGSLNGDVIIYQFSYTFMRSQNPIDFHGVSRSSTAEETDGLNSEEYHHHTVCLPVRPILVKKRLIYQHVTVSDEK